MPTYRADPTDATCFTRLLARANVPFEVERFDASVTYVAVKSVRPDIPALARSAGRSVRPVLSLEQLTRMISPGGPQ